MTSERQAGTVARMGASWCPRCGADLIAPGLYDSSWRCAQHGTTLPLTVLHRADAAGIDHIRHRSEVPLWLVDSPPHGWQLSGLAMVGDERIGIRATVSSYRGPAPLGGQGEWLFVAEETGVGLGAGYARSEARAGAGQLDSPGARIAAGGHPAPLWAVQDAGPEISGYVGEAQGVWLWIVGFPADAGYAVLEDLTLVDARVQVPGSVHGVAESASQRLRPLH